MSAELDSLLDRYDDGSLTRRELLGALASLVVPLHSARAAPKIGFVRQLNHATMFVRDVAQSQNFYQSMFGMPILTPQPPGVNLTAGTGFIGLYPTDAGEEPRIDHVCFGLDDFDADVIKRKLEAEGVEGFINLRGDTKELYFSEPNGIRIQLQDVRYRGGVGPLGAQNP